MSDIANAIIDDLCANGFLPSERVLNLIAKHIVPIEQRLEAAENDRQFRADLAFEKAENIRWKAARLEQERIYELRLQRQVEALSRANATIEEQQTRLAAAEARAYLPVSLGELFEASSFCPDDAIGGRPETGTAWNTLDIEVNTATESDYATTCMYYVSHWNGKTTRATQCFAEWSGTHDGVLIKALIDWLQTMTQVAIARGAR